MGERGDEWPRDPGVVVDGESDPSAPIEAPSSSEAGKPTGLLESL